MDGPRILAHRGACRVARENTVEAFVAAGALGADGVELDVHRSVDGVLVVHHDADVAGLGILAEHPAADIRRRLPYVPTLEESLDACTGLLVNVEVKNLPGDADFDPGDRAATGLVELLHARNRRDEVLISSFNLATIDRVRALDPALPTGLLTLLGFDPLDGIGIAADRGHSAVHPDVRSMRGAVAGAAAGRARERGLAVNVWTVDAPDEIRRLASAGVDGIVTNVPDVARAALERH
jgi:glycerophosphoryl diester phosphodiesterase